MQTGKLELQALGTFKDGAGSAGIAGYILSSTGTATAWIPSPTGSTAYIGAQSFNFGAITGTIPSTNVFFASRIFVVNTVIVNRIACSTIQGSNGASRMGIYDDAGTTLLVQSSTAASMIIGLNTFTISSTTLNAGTFYYVALQSIANGVSYMINTGYTGATTYIRSRYDTSSTDPTTTMKTSITGVGASATALWVSLYRV